jgi:hypothetical protein
MHDYPRAGDARLPLVVENRKCRALHDGADIGVFESDVRALAATFELHFLQIAARRLHEAASSLASIRQGNASQVPQRTQPPPEPRLIDDGI